MDYWLLRPLASTTLWIPILTGIPPGYSGVVLCHGEPVALDLQILPLRILQQFIDEETPKFLISFCQAILFLSLLIQGNRWLDFSHYMFDFLELAQNELIEHIFFVLDFCYLLPSENFLNFLGSYPPFFHWLREFCCRISRMWFIRVSDDECLHSFYLGL